MPTGHTHDIYSGKNVSVKDYIMNCAYSFGALRGLDGGSIPETFEPDDHYYYEALKGEARLKTFLEKSEEELQAIRQEEHDECMERFVRVIADKAEIKVRYSEMLEKLQRWEVSAPTLQSLKDYAILQINQSMEFDCATRFHEESIEKWNYKYSETSLEDWISNEIEIIKESIEYNKAEHEKHVERAKEKTEWVGALRNSLLLIKED